MKSKLKKLFKLVNENYIYIYILVYLCIYMFESCMYVPIGY